jgi:hypothetical protein
MSDIEEPEPPNFGGVYGNKKDKREWKREDNFFST